MHLLEIDATAEAGDVRLELSDALTAFIMSEHGIDSRHFLRIPQMHDGEYRFRHPTRAFELRPFVVFSDAEPDIVAAHPNLLGERRKALYERWFEGGAGRHRFMLLEKANNDTGGWDCLAVSIVLGLPNEVATKFAAGTYETVRPVGFDFASDFDSRMTSMADNVDCILVDTFIVRRNSDAPIRRVNHEGWATALLFRHIAAVARENDKIRLFVEPDEPRLKILCDAYKFTQANATLWIKDCAKSEAQDRFTASLWANVEDLRRRFPLIEGETLHL